MAKSRASNIAYAALLITPVQSHHLYFSVSIAANTINKPPQVVLKDKQNIYDFLIISIL